MMNPVDTMTMPMDSMMNPVDTMAMPVDSMTNPIDTITMPMDSMMMDTMIAVESLQDESALFKIYPMPANQFVYIETNERQLTSIELIDLNGQTVLKQQFAKILYVDHLPKGIYLLQMYKQEELIGVRKLVVQ